MIANLRGFLAHIAENDAVEAEFTWPNSGRTVSIRDAVHALGPARLVAREGQSTRLVLTEAGIRYLHTPDPHFLIAVFHAHCRFFGEALASLGDGMDHGELNQVAINSYGLSWTSLDQVRRRVNWFRATGLVEFWSDGRIVPTEEGRRVVESLTLVNPAELPGRRRENMVSVQLPEPPPLIAARLAEVAASAGPLTTRQIGYIAGGFVVERLRFLVNATVPQISRQAFRELCVEDLAVAESSAEQTLNSLRSAGLVSQVGADSFSATPLARAWLETGEPLDLLRVLHLNVGLIGEMLEAAGDETDAKSLSQVLQARYPGITLGKDDVPRRITLFLDTGLLARVGQKLHRTSLGTAFAKSLPLAPWTTEQTDHGRDTSTDASADMIEQLRQELVKSATDSANYRRFERVVAEALGALGFEVEPHGGAGKTDMIIRVWRSPDSLRRVAVEVKTDGGGIVSEQDIKFEALDDHRRLHDAEASIIVGPGFAPRVAKWAEQRGIVLITAQDLAALLTRQRRIPLSPNELCSLFIAKERDQAERVWREAERRQEALAHVLSVAWHSGNDPVEVEYSAGVLEVGDIWRESKGRLRTPLDRTEIRHALDFLATPYTAGVVRQNPEGYVVATSPDVVARKLRALAATIDEIAGPTRPTVITETEPTSSAQQVTNPKDVGASAAATSTDAAAVRAWARANNRAVPDRGRLPAALIRDYLLWRDGEQ